MKSNRLSISSFIWILVLFALLLPVPAAIALNQDWKLQLAVGERRLDAQDVDGAEICMRQALKFVRKSRGSSVEIASCMQSLALVLQMKNQTEESFPLYLRSLRLLEKIDGRNSVKVVPTLIVLGGILESEGDYKRAVKYYERSIEITQKTYGKANSDLADYQHRLGRATFEAGFPRKAEEIYSAVLSALMLQTDLKSSDLLDELLSDYIDLFRKGQPGKALSSDFQKELLKDQLGLLERTMGVGKSQWTKEVSASLSQQAAPGRIDVSETYSQAAQKTNEFSEEQRIFPGGINNLASSPAPISLGKPISDALALEQINSQRVAFYERMIATDIESLGPEHPSVARDLSGLASIYLIQHRYEQAKILLQKVLKIYKSIYGNDALLVKRTDALLNLISARQNPFEKDDIQESQFRISLPEVPLSAQKLEIVLKLNYLAFLNYSQGKVQEAATIYAWAAADTSLSCGQQSTLLAACLTDYSKVLRSAGKQDEAQEIEERAISILRRALAREAALLMP